MTKVIIRLRRVYLFERMEQSDSLTLAHFSSLHTLDHFDNIGIYRKLPLYLDSGKSASIVDLEDGIKLTFLKAGHAFDAFVRIDSRDLLLFPFNRFHRTASEAKAAFGANLRIDFEF